MSRSGRLRGRILLAVVLAFIAGCGQPEWAAQLEPVPVLDVSVFEPVVREQLEKALERVTAAQQVGDRDETAQAYGALGGMYHNYELYEAATI